MPGISKIIFANAYIGKYSLAASSLSFVNTIYVARKYGHDEVKKILLNVASFVEVCDLDARVVVDALMSGWNDCEDALQHGTAIRAGTDCIITRNKKDFVQAAIPVFTPQEFLEKEELDRIL